MKVRRRCDSEQETVALAARLGRVLAGGDVVALEGELGCGKTRFVGGLAAGMGLDPRDVASPSFIICREYSADSRPTLVHVDAFRLGGPQDLEGIGWEELLAAPDAVVAIEWANRIAAALPEARIDVAMEHAGPTSRLITITGPSRIVRRLEDPDG